MLWVLIIEDFLYHNYQKTLEIFAPNSSSSSSSSIIISHRSQHRWCYWEIPQPVQQDFPSSPFPSGQITRIPKPELRGFGGLSPFLNHDLYKVTSGEVANLPSSMIPKLPRFSVEVKVSKHHIGFQFHSNRRTLFQGEQKRAAIGMQRSWVIWDAHTIPMYIW